MEDSVSLTEIYTLSKRNLAENKKNRNWLSSKLTYLTRYDLVKPVYKGIVLDRLQLTENGKQVVGRKNEINQRSSSLKSETETKAEYQNHLFLPDVLKTISRLREENPEFEITFDVKLKS